VRRILALLIIGVAAVVASTRVQVRAQTPTSSAFEVATIKPNRSGNSGWLLAPQPGGRLVAENVPLRALILAAYQLQGVQLLGGPSWLDADRFDIAAKAEGDLPPNQMLPMVRTLLAERFKLAVHTDTRDQPIYALTLSRADGKLGPRLRPSDANCAAAAGGAFPTRADPNRPPPCGDFRMGPGSLIATGMTMAGLASRLAGRVSRIVQDRTGLRGVFDLDIEFSPDLLQQPGPPAANANPGATDSSVPSIFAALQEQLGLKLESTRGPVDVLVIDHLEHPTED
jgi:uncharacterized protein (TIGR03435 family)